MQIDPRHLIQLAVIIDKSSFTEAALALGMTQPALSKTVSELEKRIDAPLLSQRRPVVATALGNRLAEQGRLIQASLSQAGQAIKDRQLGIMSRLRVGGPPFFLESIAADIVREFYFDHPNVALEFHMTYLDQARDMVLNRQLDIALGPTNVNLNAPTLVTHTAMIANKGIFCRHGHPLTSVGNITPQHLEAQGWIGHGRTSVISREMTTDLFQAGVRNINLAVESASVSVLLSLIETTNYLAYLPLFLTRAALRTGKIAHLSLNGFRASTPFGFIAPNSTRNDLTINAFMKITGEHLHAADAEVAARCGLKV